MGFGIQDSGFGFLGFGVVNVVFVFRDFDFRGLAFGICFIGVLYFVSIGFIVTMQNGV